MYDFENSFYEYKLDMRKTFSILKQKQIIGFTIKEQDFDHADDDLPVLMAFVLTAHKKHI